MSPKNGFISAVFILPIFTQIHVQDKASIILPFITYYEVHAPYDTQAFLSAAVHKELNVC